MPDAGARPSADNAAGGGRDNGRARRPTRRLRIGEVAARTRLPPSTLRYYEARGLLPAPQRVAGQRRYDAAVVRRLALIRMAQQAGFTLREIHALLDRPDATAPEVTKTAAARQWRTLAARKLPELDALVQQLQHLRATIAGCLECGCMRFEECALLTGTPDEPPPPVGPAPPDASPSRSA